MGRAHALAFAREGARLVVSDACRQYQSIPYPLAQTEDLASLAYELEGTHQPFIAQQADVTDLVSIHSLHSGS
jgi:NAD(P)-dependent dehydrogenase (short-subunit alcohol dehydrogenase family)